MRRERFFTVNNIEIFLSKKILSSFFDISVHSVSNNFSHLSFSHSFSLSIPFNVSNCHAIGLLWVLFSLAVLLFATLSLLPYDDDVEWWLGCQLLFLSSSFPLNLYFFLSFFSLTFFHFGQPQAQNRQWRLDVGRERASQPNITTPYFSSIPFSHSHTDFLLSIVITSLPTRAEAI